MAEQKQDEVTTGGTVKAIRMWKSGKGLFMSFDELNQDFYKFGEPHCKEGDYVEIQHKAGSGNFSDKREITNIEALPDEERPEPAQTPYFQEQGKTHSMSKAVALKAAARVVGGQEIQDSNIPKVTIQVAKTFLEWLEESDDNE